MAERAADPDERVDHHTGTQADPFSWAGIELKVDFFRFEIDLAAAGHHEFTGLDDYRINHGPAVAKRHPGNAALQFGQFPAI